METNGDFMSETWKDIPGFDGAYSVSDLGRVRSNSRIDFGGRNWKGRILKDANSGGYRTVALRYNGKYVTCCIHRLVMLAFVGPSDLWVNHKNGDKSKNNLDNLEYCTPKENTKHAWETGLVDVEEYTSRLQKYNQAKKVPVDCFALDGSYVATFEDIHSAARFTGKHYTGIVSCLKGEQRTAHGYLWKRAIAC